MKWLVCRTEAIRGGTIRTSEYFPAIVECDNPEDVLATLFGEEPRPAAMRKYIVLPMSHARIVTIKPKRDFDIFVERYTDY